MVTRQICTKCGVVTTLVTNDNLVFVEDKAPIICSGCQFKIDMGEEETKVLQLPSDVSYEFKMILT